MKSNCHRMVNHLKNDALGRTAKEYASQSTIHGIAYIFDGEVDKLGRFLWLLTVLGFLALAGYFTANSWIQWREEQVRDVHILCHLSGGVVIAMIWVLGLLNIFTG